MKTPALSDRSKVIVWLAVAAGVLLVAGANMHLVYVASTTQPACVEHARDGAGAAAKSACRTE
ncbi:MAG: hypothetical protein IT547_02280 [Hyphomonadaceae bacterium]|jgi:hypothetical protein|nr:hypothetical protein [Hyphomonadaceae bacterium]